MTSVARLFVAVIMVGGLAACADDSDQSEETTATVESAIDVGTCQTPGLQETCTSQETTSGFCQRAEAYCTSINADEGGWKKTPTAPVASDTTDTGE